MANWWDEFYSTKPDKPRSPGLEPAPAAPLAGLSSVAPSSSFAERVNQLGGPSPFAGIDYTAAPPAPALPMPPKPQPAFDLGNTASALWEGATQQLVPGVKSALAQAYTGLDRPDANPEWATRWMSEGRAAQQQADARTEELRKAGQLDSTSEAIRQAIPSLGFSGVTMLGSVPAGIGAGVLAGAASANPIVGGVAGATAAGAAGGALGYRMAGSQFMNDSFAQLEEESQKRRGRGLTDQEKQQAYDALLPVAQNTGLWEAGPEAVGNAAMFGLGKIALGILPKDAMAKLASSTLGKIGVRAGAGAGALGTEVATEGVTQFVQGNDQQRGQAITEALLSGKDPNEAAAAAVPQYQGAAGLWQATKDVAPATIATVLLMGGIAKPAHMVGSAIQNRREGNAAVSNAETATADLRANLDFAREGDILTALQGYDAIEQERTLPKAARERLDGARRQLLDELQLRASPAALNESLDTARGATGYLGFAQRTNELDDAAVQEAAERPLADDAAPALLEARKAYQQEWQSRQELNQAAAHFEQNPGAVEGVAKVLGNLAAGKPMTKGAHGSVDYNLASLADEQAIRYRNAGRVLLRDHADALGKLAAPVKNAVELLDEEISNRSTGQRRDPQAIREADVAARIAKVGDKYMATLLKGLSVDALERMASGLESRAGLEPDLAAKVATIRALADARKTEATPPPAPQPAQPPVNPPAPAAPAAPKSREALAAEVAALNQNRLPTPPQAPVPAVPEPALPQPAPALPGPVVPNVQNPTEMGQRMLAEALARQQAVRGQQAPALPTPSGTKELARLLGPRPTPQTIQAPTQAQTPDLLSGPARLGIVPSGGFAQGPLALPQPGANRNAENVRSDQGQSGQGSQEGQPGLRRGPVESGVDLRGAGQNRQGPQPTRQGAASEVAAREPSPPAETVAAPPAKPPVELPAGPERAGRGGTEGAGTQQKSELGTRSPKSEVAKGKTEEWQRFDPQSGTLGVPRSEMPQVKAEHRGALVNFLDARGIAHESPAEVNPRSLKPTQAEFSPEKVAKAIDYQGGERSVLVSNDGYVLDGHHQWMASLQQNKPISVIKLDAPIARLIDEVHQFPSATVAKGISTQPNQETRREERQAEAQANAEAKALLKQEPPASPGAVPTPTKKPSRASRSAPSWNDSTRAEREAILKDTGASDAFAQRKANEWTTWDAIPEGPIKKRIRDVLADREEEVAAPADQERDKAPSNTAPVSPVLKDFKIKDGDKTYSVIRAEVLKKEDGKTFLSATIRGMKGKRQIVIDDAEFDRISAKLNERDATREAPLPDQQARFDVAEEAEMAPFEATYPGYGKVIVYPANPIPTGSNLDAEVVAYWYFRLRRKVPKADQERFGITIADEHYRISIMRRPDGKRYAQIEYPSAYQHGRDTAGNNAVQVSFRQIPSDSDAIRALFPVYDAAKSLFEKTEKRVATSEPAPGTKPDLTPAPPTPSHTEAYGKANKIFTEDAAAKARELLKRKLGQLNTGLDPEMIQAGITLAGYHIEAGARAFAAYSKAMIADLGEAARPFLRSWYEGVRYYPGFDANGMSSAKEIDALAEREADTKTEIKSDQAPPTKTTGSRALADLIKTFLRETSGKLTLPQFWGMANKAFGGSQAQGTYNSKDAYDAMELGLNLAVLADENAPLRGQDSDQVRSAIGYLEALQNRLPTQTKRDDEQQKMQQFSTPHTHAHIVAWAAGIGRNDVVLEPTAGTGNLVAHAKLFGPRSVVANELSERRDALLRQIPGVRVFNENANHLNAVLPADVKPTVVVMNPPFSADVNLPGKKDLELGATHIEQALSRLQPGGRLVAIVGRGMAMDAPRFKKWWNDIEKRYNVRANIAISGKEYTKFGTSFDNRILVIDKTGQTGLRSNIVQGEVSRVEELVDRLGGVRRERVEQQNAAGATSQTGVDRTENQSGAGQSVSAATAQEGSGESGTVSGVAAGSSRLAGRAGRSGRNAGTGARPDHSGSGANRGRGVRSDQPGPDAGGVDSGTGVPAENQPERTGRAAQEVGELEISGAIGPTDAEGFGTSAFESYRPTTSFKSAKPHPTPLSESAAMGSVKFPPLNYSPKLPADVVNEGRLSAAQLETVAYAGQAHEQILPNGERRGFFVGDGTGVGKGAQIAGIILDNWNRGRKKAVWISENSPLFADAQRDAEWVGLGKDRLLLQGKIKGEIGAKEGVLFTTYSTLTNSEKDKDGKPGVKRIDQIIAWLGKDFDGVIAFDEAHSMSNALQSKGSRGTVKPSQTALAGIELQKALPKARVVYVSATGATEVRNLVYASRLGLWGEGTAFGSAIDFVSDINGGGLAAMEVVAKDMKAMGSYTARSLSYDGVEVEQLAHELSPEQAKTYDELARAWQITLANVDAAMEASGSKKDSQARSSALSAFWGAHQRFFNAVLTALSAPSLLADAKRQLDAGNSVIMQLVNTDEATMKRRLAQASDTGQTLEELDLTPRDVLMQYLQHSFPTTLYEPYIDDNGNEGVRPVVDASGNVVQDPDAIARRDRLLENIATLKVPESILDQIINHFGSDAVAEITGRSKRIVRQQDGTAKMEKLGEAKRRGDAADFDNGKRRILVFSDAGGTGRSYHADLRIPNQQKRVHYLVQPGWRADKAIQGLGRSHRTNQAQPPLFKTVTTTIKSQARFVSSIARRMNQMGALTKGQRDATSGQGMFDDDMNLENEYSQQALVSLFYAIARGEVNGVTVADIEQQMGIRLVDAKTGQILQDKIPNIQRFLNRLLSLDIAMMDRVFDEFDTRRRNNIEYAKQNGFYDQGMETLRAISVKKDEDVVAITHPGGSTTRYVKLTVTHESKLLPFDSLHPDAFFASNKSSGKLYAFEPATSITNPETGGLIERVRRVSPDSVRYMPVREAENREKYDRLDLTKSQKKTEWAKATAAAPKTYDQTLHMVSGALLPVWDRLPRDGSSRVIRAQTDTKERLIGRVIENKSLKETLTRLGVSRDAPKLDGRQAIDAIVQNNATIELANGWKLVRRTVNNQPRIEVLNVAIGGDRSVLIGMGAFSEIINYQSRLFLPSDNAGILDRLFASKPVVDVVEPSIRRSSPSSSPVKPATIAQARSNLKRAVGADLIDALEKTGKLVFHESDPTGAAGFVDRNGIIHLIPANMDQAASSVQVHEAVHIARDNRFAEGDRNRIRLAHAVLGTVGLRNFIGNPGFTDLVQQVRRMAAEGDRTAQEALAKAKREDPNNVDEESVAYLAQYADEKLPLVRRILAAIRAALYRMGIKVQLTPADVRALAVSALKNHARQVAKTAAVAGQRKEAFSLPDSPRSNRIDYSQPTTTEDAAEQERLWQEFQAVRAQFQAKEAMKTPFARWFGDGIEGITARDGKPIALYHGTSNPTFNQWDASRIGQATRQPTAGLGFFMTADRGAAARFGSNVLELNARINKPYYLTDADLWAIDSLEAAAKLRGKLQAQGYDGAVLAEPGMAPYVIVFNSNQAKFVTNENPTDNEDFRYSIPGRPARIDTPRVAAKVMNDIGGVRDALKPGESLRAKADPRNWAQMLSDLKSNARPAWLGLLTRNMQLELAREVLPRGAVTQFDEAAEAMDAYESRMIQSEGFPLAERWQNLMLKAPAQADRLSQLLYLSTWTGVDPRKPAEKGKEAAWTRAKAAFDAMADPNARALYGDVLAFYGQQTKRLFDELQARIDRTALPEKERRAAGDVLRKEFERMKQDGPYVPLMRFGDLTVFAEPRREGEKPVFATFETVQDQRAFADWLKREGYAPKLGVKADEIAKRALPAGDMVEKLAAIVDQTTKGPQAQVLKDAMYQLFLRSLPEQSIRKHFIHRRYVPGYSADALRTFATFARRSAKQIARLAHSDRLSEALDDMAAAAKTGDLAEPVAAGHLVNELDKTFQWIMNPTTNAVSSRLTHLGFMWHLGASPAHFFLNLSQQAQVTFPWLAGELHGKIGAGRIAAALAKANRDFLLSNPFVAPTKRGPTAVRRRSLLESEFGGDMGRALQALEEAGKTDKTQTYSLAGLSEEDSWLWSRPYLRKFTQGATWFFHTAEVINREATAIAAYRLARNAGMGHEAAYDLARRAINETHFDYSPSNRARFMRGNVAKVLTLFKQYSLNVSWQLARNLYLMSRGASPEVKAQARTKLLGMLGMTALMAGAAGLPLYGELMWLITQALNAGRDDDEPEWDADAELRELLNRAVGQPWSMAARKGLMNAFLGIDVSSRVKLDDLWWRSDERDLEGKQLAYSMMEQALGPVAGLFVRGVSTVDGLYESLVTGENARGASWKSVEGALPKTLKDISRSIRYAREGATTQQGATVMPADRFTTANEVGQALGFTPAELAERYAVNRSMKNLEQHIVRRRQALLDMMAMALRQGDEEAKEALIEDVKAFNRRYPTVAITGETLRQSLQAKARALTATEAAGGVSLNRNLIPLLAGKGE